MANRLLKCSRRKGWRRTMMVRGRGRSGEVELSAEILNITASSDERNIVEDEHDITSTP